MLLLGTWRMESNCMFDNCGFNCQSKIYSNSLSRKYIQNAEVPSPGWFCKVGRCGDCPSKVAKLKLEYIKTWFTIRII